MGFHASSGLLESAPDAGVDLAQLVRLAEKAVAGRSKDFGP